VQFASFDLGDPVFELCGLRVSVQLVTLENLYGVAPAGARIESTPSGAIVHARGLRWAGGSEPADGELTLAAEREPDGAVRLRVTARAPAPVRSVKLLVRDFMIAGLMEKEAWLRALALEVVAGVPGASVDVHVEEQYRNMREVIDQHPLVVERAREAIALAGLQVHERAIRGGTDGSRLSFMGLPTPNIFAGEQNFHSRLEWVSVQDMEKAVEVIVELARVWEERA